MEYLEGIILQGQYRLVGKMLFFKLILALYKSLEPTHQILGIYAGGFSLALAHPLFLSNSYFPNPASGRILIHATAQHG